LDLDNSMDAAALATLHTHLLTSLDSVPAEARRIFHGRGRRWPGLEQLTVDWLQGVMLVSLFRPVEDAFAHALHDTLMDVIASPSWTRAGAHTLILQHRYTPDAACEWVIGEAQGAHVVEEDGLRYGLSLGRNQNIGLFLDMRYGRQWVRQVASGRRVLNLFAYTCGFSVAALAGGATHVVNLDMARSALSQGRENHRLNEHALDRVSFLGHELFKSWGKVRKTGPYDLVIIDPPSFQKGSFALTTDYRKILRKLPELCTADAHVLACVNDPGVSPEFILQSMAEEAPMFDFVRRLDNPPEFADIDSEGGLKAMVFTRSARAGGQPGS
jgi:23S rRNA (cytosine1962-C5)-methyltransferase